MDQFDREDSSNYTSSQPRSTPPEPVTEPAAERPTFAPVQPQKTKKSKAPLILSLLLLLALAGAAVFGWMWYQQSGELDNVRTDLSSQRNKVSQLESQIKAKQAIKEDTSGIVTDTDSTGSDTIIEKAIEYSSARTGNQGFVNGTTSREGKIAKQTTEFAKVTVSSPSGPGTETVYLKATSEDKWVVIGDGTEDIAQLENGFGLPKGF